jgi:hypothetical protein
LLRPVVSIAFFTVTFVARNFFGLADALSVVSFPAIAFVIVAGGIDRFVAVACSCRIVKVRGA